MLHSSDDGMLHKGLLCFWKSPIPSYFQNNELFEKRKLIQVMWPLRFSRRWLWRIPSSGMRRSVDLVLTDVLTLVPRSRIILPWRWRQYVPPKRRLTQDLHGAISQKTAFLIQISSSSWAQLSECFSNFSPEDENIQFPKRWVLEDYYMIDKFQKLISSNQFF
jgi:hypothetical protein